MGSLIIEEAFEKFESLIYSSDKRLFRSTTLQDVREAARIIDRDQAQRRCLRNLRRIQPLLQALGRFGGALDTLCQGTPYLCYIWVRSKSIFASVWLIALRRLSNCSYRSASDASDYAIIIADLPFWQYQ